MSALTVTDGIELTADVTISYMGGENHVAGQKIPTVVFCASS